MPASSRSSLVVATVLLLGGCEDKPPHAFNREASALVCAIEYECGDILSSGIEGDFPENFTCEDMLIERYDTCSSECAYREASARRCIERLEYALDTCEVPNLRACRRTYWGCPNDCQIWNCKVSPGSRPLGGIAFGLFVVVLVALRRRRTSERSG